MVSHLSPPSDPKDHVAWVQFLGGELNRHLSRCVNRQPVMVVPNWDYDVECAVRTARSLHYRFSKLSSTAIKRLIRAV